jgi:hypothetical protein
VPELLDQMSEVVEQMSADGEVSSKSV